ncbi:MAG: serine/threonine-protein phosphatase [Phycisphaerae bacterium]|nr:serine/threonine-protein phosphatase [Phycisphaerae bacterium]NNF44336.1 serine/threonine-protein phosphatase [Phycisphaerales bacterium]
MRARSIHESLFPARYEDTAVQFDYSYTPMRELGGDFVHLHVGGEGLIHLTVLDVTGHGLAAALTVNRLSGELERIHAEHPQAEPGHVLSLLNRYVQLTMARHHIYTTAACVTLDPYLGELRWASGGHPPAYLRRADGDVETMPATTVLLGAVDDERFDARTERMDMSPGDTLILFTDGVFEARDRSRQQFGLDRLRRLIGRDPAPADWPRVLTAAVTRHDGGQHEDDILVAVLRFLAPRRDVDRSDSPDPVAAAEPTG